MTDALKALTLYPEHVELFRLGIRTIETRGWATSYRGLLHLHAGMRDPDSAAARRDPLNRVAMDAIPHGNPITRGAVVATCTLADVVPIAGPGDHTPPGWTIYANRGQLYKGWRSTSGHAGAVESVTDQFPFGDFTPGRYAWLLTDVTPLAEPIPAKGRQGLWTWER